MRLSIAHETRYAYDVTPNSVIEVLRLTPASSATQSLRDWRITLSGDAPLRRFDDAYGNICHTVTTEVPDDGLVITASGIVETSGSSGVVSGTRERLPAAIFLRETPLTAPDAALASLADDAAAQSDGSSLAFAHALNRLVYERVTFDGDATDTHTTASEALAAGRGVCQDLTHVMCAAARAHGIPARYVSGYQFEAGRARDTHAGHAWAELDVAGLGWVGFDPTAGRSPDESYVRVAVGLDTASASPVRGATYGGFGERLSVTVTMEERGRPGAFQSQSQS
ncbi:MAG: transglutaminase family protein [Pseudomonadota bacterium]